MASCTLCCFSSGSGSVARRVSLLLALFAFFALVILGLKVRDSFPERLRLLYLAIRLAYSLSSRLRTAFMSASLTSKPSSDSSSDSSSYDESAGRKSVRSKCGSSTAASSCRSRSSRSCPGAL